MLATAPSVCSAMRLCTSRLGLRAPLRMRVIVEGGMPKRAANVDGFNFSWERYSDSFIGAVLPYGKGTVKYDFAGMALIGCRPIYFCQLA